MLIEEFKSNGTYGPRQISVCDPRRDLAAKAGISPSTVGRIWRAFGLKPWLTDTFKLSEDPQLVDKVRDVVGLYMNPPEHEVVMCVDDKTSIQALDRTQPSLPMRPGQIERRTHDYKRHGVTDLFAALNLATGQVVHQTPAPGNRVQQVPRGDQRVRAGRSRSAYRVGQPIDAQDPSDPRVAVEASGIHVPLHPDVVVVDEPCRALVCSSPTRCSDVRSTNRSLR